MTKERDISMRDFERWCRGLKLSKKEKDQNNCLTCFRTGAVSCCREEIINHHSFYCFGSWGFIRERKRGGWDRDF